MNKISSIRPDVVVSDGKQTLLDTLANAYDELATQHGREPVAVVFAFIDELGNTRTGYHTLACVQDRNILYVTRGTLAISGDCSNIWDNPNA